MFSWLKRKQNDYDEKKGKGVWTDEDREKSLLSRKKNLFKKSLMELKQMEIDAMRERIEEVKAERELQIMQEKYERMQDEFDDGDDGDDEEESDSPEAMLISGLMNLFGSSKTTPKPQPVHQAVPLPDVTDEEIQSIVDRIPKGMRTLAKRMPKEKIIEYAKQHYSGLTESTYDRFAEAIKQ